MSREYIFPFILFAIIWIFYRVVASLLLRKFSLRSEVINGLFVFSVVSIYILTIYPMPFYYPYFEKGISTINFIPFASITQLLEHFDYFVVLRNIGGNIFLFLPLGFLLPLRFKKLKFGRAVLIGFFISAMVEVIQLFVPLRSFDVDDLLLNTLGTAIGYYFFSVSNLEKIRLPSHAFTKK